MLKIKSSPIFIILTILAITILPACGGSGTAVDQDGPEAASNSKFELGEKNGCMIIEKMLRSKDNFLSVKEPNVPDVNL
ncbi:MAG TPA: hypothetical protein VGD99_27725 [Anaerolineae bacterium]|jgi:hypothetical protein